MALNLFKSGPFGLAINSQIQHIVSIENNQRPPLVPDCDDRICGHFVIDRYTVDNEGHIAFTQPTSIDQLCAEALLLRVELDSLLRQARKRYPNLMQPWGAIRSVKAKPNLSVGG